MGVDSLPDPSYDSDAHHVSLSEPAAERQVSQLGKFRRRSPHPREQAKREAWGAKWGPLVREAARAIREEEP